MRYPEDPAGGTVALPIDVDSTSTVPEDLLALALSVVRPAADLARRMRVEGITDVTTKSTETDVVTAADKAVEQRVIDAIHSIRPQDTILGEEFGTSQADTSSPAASAIGALPAVEWILDPIDGTVNYLYGLPAYAVSLAAVVKGEVVAGVVRNIATGTEWTATVRGGAYVNGRRLSGSRQTLLSQSLVATGFAYDAACRARQARVVAGLLPRIRDIRRIGAASIDLCMAAEGRVDAYYERGLNPWDHAAGGLIAAEAGLMVTGLDGAQPGKALLIAAPPALHGALHDALVALGVLRDT